MTSIDLITPKGFAADSTDFTGEKWVTWKQQFEMYMRSKDIDKAEGPKQVAVLLTAMGGDAVKLYYTFAFAPAVAADEAHNIAAIPAQNKDSLADVLVKFDQHYGVKRFRNVRRQAFHNRRQEDGESVMSFISDLQHQVTDCEYGTASSSLLCDRIVQGIRDEHVKMRLLDLGDDDLTVESAIRICRASELTRKQANALSETTVHHADEGYAGAPRRRQNGGRDGASRYKPRDDGGDVTSSRRQSNGGRCERCTRRHERGRCPAYEKTCNRCGERGHFAASQWCRGPTERDTGRSRPSRGRGNRGHQHVHQARADDVKEYHGDYGTDHHGNYEQREMDDLADMFEQKAYVRSGRTQINSDDWYVVVNVFNRFEVNLEIDTGAGCNILSLNTVKRLGLLSKMQTSPVTITSIHDQTTRVEGAVTIPITYKGDTWVLTFCVLKNSTDLLGKADIVKLGLIARVNIATCESACRALVDQYTDVLGDEIGCVPGEYDIQLDSSVKPVVHAPRSIPAPIRVQVKEELDLLERKEIIEKVTEPTEWVNSMVVVRKKSGRVRICIDPTNLNEAILREHYPMNTIEDISTRLSGSKYYSVLDANMGYFQIKLSERSSTLTTFNTPFGRYKYLRLPMGIKSSSDIYQRKMIEAFGHIDGVEVVVDDILVHGETLQQHNERLQKVLQRAREINLKFNSSKCKIAAPEVIYIGHKLTRNGLQVTDERVKYITEMRSPENKAELETVLGMIAYVAKFIPNLSDLNAPLRHLKKQDTEWKWGTMEEEAFKKIKDVLSSKPVLKYYDAKKPVKLTVDASMKGLGAAAIQDGGIIAYASRALTPTEQRYAQIEKEMLAVVFGCSRFHKLIYGMPNVTIESDHKPLESLMKKPIHASPMRIQKMMLKLQPYELKLVYVKGKDLGLADCLSRMPHTQTQEPLMDDDLMVCVAETASHGHHAEIEAHTAADNNLQEVINTIKDGWPEDRGAIPPSALPYWNYRDEMSVYNGVIFKGERLCIPKTLRPRTLKALHRSHSGIVKCKQRARDVMWWPGMNAQIEEMVNKCEACLQYRSKPPKEPMTIAPIPKLPWSKVGADLFQLGRNNFLVLVDYYSNYFELEPLQETTSSEVINKIRANISRHGIMTTMMTDNGPQFTSKEFKEFVKSYEIDHITSSPHHQQANGLAENAVKTAKRTILKCRQTGDDIYLALLELRNTPRDGEIGSPAQRLMGRRTRTMLPMSEKLLQPSGITPTTVQSRLLTYRERQKEYYDRGSKPRKEIKEGDAIRILTDDGWKPAEHVRRHDAPNSHIIRSGDQARELRRNMKEIIITREEPHKITRRPHTIPPNRRGIRPIHAPPQIRTPPQIRAPPQIRTPPRNIEQTPPPRIIEQTPQRNIEQNPQRNVNGNPQRITQPPHQEIMAHQQPRSRYGRHIKPPSHLREFVRT